RRRREDHARRRVACDPAVRPHDPLWRSEWSAGTVSASAAREAWVALRAAADGADVHAHRRSPPRPRTQGFELVQQGKLKIRIGASYPLREARQAHIDVQARRTSGKTLLVP